MRITEEKLKQEIKKSLKIDKIPAVIEKAFLLAYQEHQGQYRSARKAVSGSRIPYIVHPVGVLKIASHFIDDTKLNDTKEEVFAICLLHDVVEDTYVEIEKIEKEISMRVAEIVLSLTKPIFKTNVIKDRNKIFTEQIIKSGRTAMFVKICDYLHNISNPQQTPPYILKKLIQKGKVYYSTFFQVAKFPDKLQKAFNQQTAEAEKFLQSHTEEITKTEIKTLEDAVKYCAIVAEEKTLELHDIAEILTHVTCADFVKIGPKNEFMQTFVPESVKKSQKKMAEIDKKINQGEIEINNKVIFIIKLDEFFEGQYCFISFNKQSKKTWVKSEVLKIIITFLSERIRIQHKNITKSLAIQAAHLNLNLSLNDLIVLDQIKINLFQFKRFLDYAEYIRKKIISVIEYQLFEQIKNKNSIIIQSRVKTASSIIAKLQRRKIKDFTNLDDVVGIRIICIKKKEIKNLINILKSTLQKYFLNTENYNDDSVKVRNVTSSDGYKAYHINLVAGNNIKVGCEIQIRTIQQQAWSEISHHIIYKEKTTNQKRIKNILKKLAYFRDCSDELIDEI
jgi:ppGpp synthetase/RelA/SpoT-type nucleotidyltranferase